MYHVVHSHGSFDITVYICTTIEADKERPVWGMMFDLGRWAQYVFSTVPF